MSAPSALPNLLPGSYRGVPFFMEHSSRVSGQRKAEFPLAGSDVTLFEDLGRLAGPIQVQGYYIGDDFLAVEAAMRAAFEQPGPGLLVHPWYGPVLVELAFPGETHFAARGLRSFHLRACFKPASNPVSLALSTLAALAGAADALSLAASPLLIAGMSIAGAAASFISLSATMTHALAAGVGSSLFSTLRLSPVPSRLTGATIHDWAQNWYGSVAASGSLRKSAAIAPGPAGRNTSSLVDPRVASRALWGVSDALAGSNSGRARALAVGLSSLALAASVAPHGDISFESRQDAMAWRAEAVAAFDRGQAFSASLISSLPTDAGKLWSALGNLRRAIVEDIDERIGRLPSVIEVAAPAQTSAWIVAQHLAGDDPTRLAQVMQDIVTRNRLWHPAAVGPGTIEALP